MRDRALRAISECWKIAAMSEEPHRITRRFLTAAVHDVHAHMRARMEAHAMTVHVDAAGNLRGLWQPANASPKRLILGSHIDTCLLYTSPSPRDISGSRMPSSA